MSNLIVVSPEFDGNWPYAADHANALWSAGGPTRLIRKPGHAHRLGQRVPEELRAGVTRMLVMGGTVTRQCAADFPSLREVALVDVAADAQVGFCEKGVAVRSHRSEGFWGQSVAEFALGLTIGALRRIPQTHHQILTSHAPWDYAPPGGMGRPGSRGCQFGDDPNFSNGTVAGKRVRVVGMGNVGSRYAHFTHALGADVVAWDPVAAEPAFHRTGARQTFCLEDLIHDAEIFAPMMPLRDATRGIVTAEHINSLPRGCLVVLVTRAEIVDVPTLRRRVCNDELALAADVFDVEPLAFDDPLLGRHNVVHTPHNAGRTKEANFAFASSLLAQFR